MPPYGFAFFRKIRNTVTLLGFASSNGLEYTRTPLLLGPLLILTLESFAVVEDTLSGEI